MNRKATLAIVSAIVSIASFATTATAAPLSATAGSWVQTNDEAGWSFVSPAFGAPRKSAAPADVKPLDFGDISVDRQYIYSGEGGWQLRPIEYRFQDGRFVQVDDSVGHMRRLTDSPAMKDQRADAERLGGG